MEALEAVRALAGADAVATMPAAVRADMGRLYDEHFRRNVQVEHEDVVGVDGVARWTGTLPLKDGTEVYRTIFLVGDVHATTPVAGAGRQTIVQYYKELLEKWDTLARDKSALPGEEGPPALDVVLEIDPRTKLGGGGQVLGDIEALFTKGETAAKGDKRAGIRYAGESPAVRAHWMDTAGYTFAAEGEGHHVGTKKMQEMFHKITQVHCNTEERKECNTDEEVAVDNIREKGGICDAFDAEGHGTWGTLNKAGSVATRGTIVYNDRDNTTVLQHDWSVQVLASNIWLRGADGMYFQMHDVTAVGSPVPVDVPAWEQFRCEGYEGNVRGMQDGTCTLEHPPSMPTKGPMQMHMKKRSEETFNSVAVDFTDDTVDTQTTNPRLAFLVDSDLQWGILNIQTDKIDVADSKATRDHNTITLKHAGGFNVGTEVYFKDNNYYNSVNVDIIKQESMSTVVNVDLFYKSTGARVRYMEETTVHGAPPCRSIAKLNKDPTHYYACGISKSNKAEWSDLLTEHLNMPKGDGNVKPTDEDVRDVLRKMCDYYPKTRTAHVEKTYGKETFEHILSSVQVDTKNSMVRYHYGGGLQVQLDGSFDAARRVYIGIPHQPRNKKEDDGSYKSNEDRKAGTKETRVNTCTNWSNTEPETDDDARLAWWWCLFYACQRRVPDVYALLRLHKPYMRTVIIHAGSAHTRAYQRYLLDRHPWQVRFPGSDTVVPPVKDVGRAVHYTEVTIEIKHGLELPGEFQYWCLPGAGVVNTDTDMIVRDAAPGGADDTLVLRGTQYFDAGEIQLATRSEGGLFVRGPYKISKAVHGSLPVALRNGQILTAADAARVGMVGFHDY
jgi:hypothetical protein